MSRKETEKASSFWSGLSSIRLTIALLIILAAVSIIGTVIPQNLPPQEYLRAYTPATYKILKILGFLDMYHSGWFVALLALLSLNLATCSWRGFRTTWKFFSHPQERLEESSWKALPFRQGFSRQTAPGDSFPPVRQTLDNLFHSPRIQHADGAYHLFAEKGKLSRLGVYFIHLSVLIILAGALIGTFFGFRGDLQLVEGESADQVVLRGGKQAQPLGYKVKLEKFSVSFYPSGAPQEFKSVVTIEEGGRTVRTEPLRVNHPLTYRGISFYQATYGAAGIRKVVLAIQDRETGKELLIPAALEARMEIPGQPSSFMLADFDPNFQGMGPAFQVLLFDSKGPHNQFVLFKDHPELEDRRPGRWRFQVRDLDLKYYSGLQVTKDPGVWVVWAGCFLMMAGFYLAFFLSHRRVWVKLSPRGEGTRVEVGGSTHRDRLGFGREFARLCQALGGPSLEKIDLEARE
ncbi:MAG: cytochrome c biogenesis protein ResB [Deltaproteobacteria bacterium]|nr:cytochrome c biogenesis protein ResB [Deltaproteobacteria bacterium]